MAGCHNEPSTAQQTHWRLCSILIGQHQLARNAHDPSVDAPGLRQELFPNAGIAAICTDEKVANSAGAVGEAQADTTFGSLGVIDQRLVKANNVIEAGEEDLAQCNATCGMVVLDCVASSLHLESEQLLHSLGKKTEAAAGDTARRAEGLVKPRRQAIVQRAAAARTDMDAVSLQPIGACPIALTDRDVYARLFEPLRETKTSDAAADDGDVKRLFDHLAAL
jgi:hypothetical protein